MGCTDSQKFKTSEASTKAAMRTQGAIDKFLNILDINKFRRLNVMWSQAARERYGTKEMLFLEENNKAYPNKTVFQAIDRAKGIYYQSGDKMSEASAETITKVKEVIKKMGVNILSLKTYLRDHPEVDKNAEGVADIVYKIIAVAEGKENIALTEEMVHIATSIIEQKSPALMTELISKIDRFEIYKRTLELYKDNKAYQLADGKPNIRKIKKEAVDKLIAEVIINQNEGTTEFPELLNESNQSLIRTWWQKIIDWFKGEYRKTNINLFEQVAEQIMEGNLSIEDLSDVGGVYYQLSAAQTEIQQKLMKTREFIRKVESKESVDPVFMDTEEANNWYEYQDEKGVWKRVKKRVTDRVKAWYKSKFRDKTFTKEEKEFNEFKRQYGIKGHQFLQEIAQRFFDSDTGVKRATPLARPFIVSNVDREVYLKLEKYFMDLIRSKSKGGKTLLVFPEVIIYDSIEKEAGTLDLLIIDEEGVADILDWKFMSVGKSSEDIAWYKQGAYNIQLGRYKDILLKRYDVKKIGMNRAIPILMDIAIRKTFDKTSMAVKGINIGSVDTTKIEDIKLLPVSEQSELTGIEALDEMIAKLNALHKQISKYKVTDEEEREFKRDRLNIIKKAVRIMQTTSNISPLIDAISILRQEGEMLVEYYNSHFKDKSPSEFTNKEISEFANNINDYLSMSHAFDDADVLLGDLLYTPGMEDKATTKAEKEDALERKEIHKQMISELNLIKLSRIEVQKISKSYADKFIGLRNLVAGLLKPEAVVKGLSSLFRGVSELPLASLRILTKLVNEAKGMASQDAMHEVDELLAIRKKLADRGGDLRKLVQKIYQRDNEDKIVNKLIHRYKKDFYDGVNNNALEANRDKQWLFDNIDVEEYRKEASKMLEDRIKRIEDIYKDNQELKDDLILEERQRWDIDRKDFTGFNNFIIKRHPLIKWESDEYKELKNDTDLMELYDFINKINQKATDVGYIENKIASTFLPYIRKGMAESLAWDFSLSAVGNWVKTLEVRTDDAGYGQINELTGEIENSIPKYYTTDFTEEGVEDFKDVSEDIFKNMILYITHMEQYKYLSEIEGQISLVRTVETFKKHLDTNRTAEVIFKDGRPDPQEGNKENTELFDVFTRALLYGQKYPLSDADTGMNVTKAINFMKKAINKVAGKEVYSLSDEKTNVASLIKTMDAINRAFQLKTLGLEVVSGAANIFGGNIQVATQAGNYFKAREFLKNEMKLIGNKFRNNEEREMFVQLVDIFMPLKDDPNYERLKKAGMSALTRANFSDMLMVFMRNPEQHLEKSVFLTLLENMMVIDGKIVSIPEFVRKKYKGRYSSGGAYREYAPKIKQEIEELKKNKSINATKKLEDGKLVIPGLDLTNRAELQRLTNLTQRISRNATGALSGSDLNKMGLSIWTNSMMVFKRWIPKLVDTRFSEFRRVSDDFSIEVTEDGFTTGDKYDIGRVRLLLYVLGTSIRDTSMNITNILSMNDQGIAALDKMYEEFSISFEKRNGYPLEMSREDFFDLIRNNLRNQIKELAMALSLVGAAFALGMVGPDDDKDKASKNAHRYAQRVVDKFTQELLFFYNPVEFQNLLSGSMFPAIGLFSDITRAITHITKQFTGYDISNPNRDAEEVRKRAHPIKNIARLFPGTKSFMTYGAMFDSEFAKEFDITVQSQTGR